MTGGGAFLIEVIITAVFVLVVLSATAKTANVAISGAVIGLGLALANLVADAGRRRVGQPGPQLRARR